MYTVLHWVPNYRTAEGTESADRLTFALLPHFYTTIDSGSTSHMQDALSVSVTIIYQGSGLTCRGLEYAAKQENERCVTVPNRNQRIENHGAAANQ